MPLDETEHFLPFSYFGKFFWFNRNYCNCPSTFFTCSSTSYIWLIELCISSCYWGVAYIILMFKYGKDETPGMKSELQSSLLPRRRKVFETKQLGLQLMKHLPTCWLQSWVCGCFIERACSNRNFLGSPTDMTCTHISPENQRSQNKARNGKRQYCGHCNASVFHSAYYKHK